VKRFVAVFLLMVACVLAPFSAHALDAPSDLVPTGLNVGDQFYVVFTTSTYTQATSTSISFYHSYVQGVAAASTISGVRAISSGFQVIGATTATNQCKPTNLTKPVYNVNKTLVSSLASLMYDPGAQALGISLKISESGQDISGAQGQAFTGCNSNGSSYTGFNLGDTSVGLGSTTVTNTDWISIGGSTVSNNQTKSLYAISALLTVATPAAQAVPSLSEWAQLMLGLMVISILGWHFHRERSY
jgi:hypothetical protein